MRIYAIAMALVIAATVPQTGLASGFAASAADSGSASGAIASEGVSVQWIDAAAPARDARPAAKRSSARTASTRSLVIHDTRRSGESFGGSVADANPAVVAAGYTSHWLHAAATATADER